MIGLMGSYLIFQAQKNSKASGETVNLTFSPTTGTATTTIRIQPSKALFLRGYQFQISFDKSKISITDISYKTGVVSLGLGDDNTNLEQVNQKGLIEIQGEIQTPTGQVLGTDLTDVIAITFANKSTDTSPISIDSLSTKFYTVNKDNSLSEIPTVAGVTFMVR